MIQKNKIKETIIKPDEMSMNEALEYLGQVKKKNPDKDIKSITITIDGEYVDVKYTFGALSKEVSGYDIKIVPNADNDFAFTVDGEVYSFSAIDDCTKAFEIAREETSFTIYYTSMQDVLDKIYEDSEVKMNKKDIDFEKDQFTVIVTSYNGESSICIGFRLADSVIDKVSLSEEVIEF